uniref:Uncharacterized protein n=1 Tax=Aliivibrio wodanis TaxID=80852 RepID=A0A5Q4Z3Y1_9GAMM|nr:hypothetical protein AW0309160_00170 [Aliivibrio wodanis]
MRIFIFLCFSLFSLSSLANSSLVVNSSLEKNSNGLSVTLTQENLLLTFEQSARLEAVLQQTQLHTQIGRYSVGSILSSDDHQGDINKVKQATLEQLNQFSLSSPLFSKQETPYKKEADTLSHQLNSFSFVSRLFIPLDYDLIRIKKESNPKLTGNYSLFIAQRPKTITVLGAIDSSLPVTLDYQQRAKVEDYLTQINTTSNANTSQIYVIQPDGEVKIATNNYWQHNTTSIAPGATVFIGFADLPTQLSTLNDDIVELLRNKVN